MARVSAIDQHETVWSSVQAGNTHTSHCLQDAVFAAETALELAPAQRKRTVWRIDGGGGSDENMRFLLKRGYQFITKGTSNRRAEMLSRQVKRWDAYRDVWLGRVAPPADYGHEVQTIVKRRFQNDKPRHSYYISTLKQPSKGALMRLYDARGAAEVEQFRNDKSGLSLAMRRKQALLAQHALVLLTDLAHNLLADFQRQVLVDTPMQNWGPKRIVRDLLQMPGQLLFDGPQLKSIFLSAAHPYADCMVEHLPKLFSANRNPLHLQERVAHE